MSYFPVLYKGWMRNQWRIQDFPEEGPPTSEFGGKPIIWQNFAENCIPDTPLDPPMVEYFQVLYNKYLTSNCHNGYV